jgi:uncharacterized membrane protein
MLDLVLAIAHHLLIFAIFAILFTEFWVVRPGMGADFIRWRKLGTAPDDAAVRGQRRYLHAELALFVLLPIFAAAMARGYGEF